MQKYVQNKTVKNYPSDRVLKKMGFFSDQDGILKRYLSEIGNWEQHLKNSKDYIIKYLETTKPKSIAILGSGWLLDVPMEYLVENIKYIRLYDIRHPRQIRHKYKNLKNCEFLTIDITGGAINGIYNLVKNNSITEKSINELEIDGFIPQVQSDYTISLNIMNQLDILIVEYIRKKTGLTEEDLLTFRKKIQESHFKSLPENHSLLITDYFEEVYDRRGKLIKEGPLIHILLPDSPDRENWIWDFDTQMTYYPNRKTRFRVLAQPL